MTQKIDAERLKEAADIERIVGQYIELKRGGNSNERVGLCPFHKEDTPSFTLNTDKQCGIASAARRAATYSISCRRSRD